MIPCVKSHSFELLMRFRQKASAKNLFKVLGKSLARVGLKLKDIRGLTTDAASVMQKLGRLIAKAVAPAPFYHQLCLAHALHLAVLDTFEGKNSSAENPVVDHDQSIENPSVDLELGAETWQLVDMQEAPYSQVPGEW